MAVVAYYSFEDLDTGEYRGLLRLIDRRRLEYATPDGWRPDPGDPARLLFPGADAPDLIPLEKARELAQRYGVTVGGA